jgi:hypothetical protein
MKTENQLKFHSALVAAYSDLFKTDPSYAYSASKCTPEGLADKILAAGISGSINKDGEGVKRACKACGIPYTLKAILSFVADPDAPKPENKPAAKLDGIGKGKIERIAFTGINSMLTGVVYADRQRNTVRLTYTDGTTERAEVSAARWEEIKENGFAITSEVQSQRATESSIAL